MIRALLVDDEQHARNLFKGLVQMANLDIDIVGEAEHLPGAVQYLSKHKVDVVFMDIDMPNYSGLQFADFFGKYDFLLVYVTAHGHHVIDALRIKAFDYLIKPIDLDDLKNCIKRIHEELSGSEPPLAQEENPRDKIAIHSLTGVDYVKISQILYLEASAMYTTLRTENGEEFVVSKPLKEFEFLQDHGFFRIHRSFIVNVKKIKRYLVIEGNEVEVVDGQKIPVSRNRKEDFMHYLNKEFKIIHK